MMYFVQGTARRVVSLGHSKWKGERFKKIGKVGKDCVLKDLNKPIRELYI